MEFILQKTKTLIHHQKYCEIVEVIKKVTGIDFTNCSVILCVLSDSVVSFYQFLFHHDHYESICHNIEQLDIKALRESEKEDGLDGTMCTLSFGYEDEVQTFNIWSPTDSTNQRGLFLFKLCCEQILRAGGLKPEEIF